MTYRAKILGLLVALLVPVLLLLSFHYAASGAGVATEVGGPILADTTWTKAKSPYIVTADIEVQKGVTLTVEAGTIVRFDGLTGIDVNGHLIVEGVQSEPVLFTSNKTNPESGDWDGISFSSEVATTTMDSHGNYLSGSLLRGCVVEYAGNGSAAIEAGTLLIDRCIVRHISGIAIQMQPHQSLTQMPGRIVNSEIFDSEELKIYNSSVISSRIHSSGGIFASAAVIQGNEIYDNISAVKVSGGGIYAEKGSLVTGNNIYDNWAMFDGGGIYAEESTVTNNSVRANISGFPNLSHGRGGGIYARSSVVEGNLVLGNRSLNEAGGIYATGLISGNVISHNFVEGTPGVYWLTGGGFIGGGTIVSNTIAFNVIYGNHGSLWRGSGAYLFGGEFNHNTVVHNAGPANSTAGGLEILQGAVHGNNLYGNSPYDVTVDASSPDISGTNNYFGGLISENISGQIVDWYDDSGRARFFFAPYLQEPDRAAPVAPPAGLTLTPHNGSFSLSWDQPPGFTTGWGYKLYYDNDSPLPPFEGEGVTAGDSPIDVEDKTGLDLDGLDTSKDYHFAITVYDNRGRESWYSPGRSRISGYWIYLPAISK